MKKFRFRLDRVLDVRKVRQREKLGRLGAETRKLDTEQDKMRIFVNEAGSQTEAVRLEQAQPFTAWVHCSNHRYLDRVRRVIDFQREVVNAQERQVQMARNEYIEARRDTKVLEKLKESKLSVWKQEAEREEIKTLDEHAAANHRGGSIT